MKPDKLLVFDILGPFAHFRKYYTNVSSLSYNVPPRTVIAGLIAGILGIERDDYYDKFNVENTRIGVSIKSKFRKIMQTVNYYNIEFKNKSLRYQVPLEILVPIELNEKIKYRIYFYNEKYISELSRRVKEKKYVYNPYLGISEFLADIKYVSLTEDDKIKKIKPTNKINIASCFKKQYIEKLDFKNSEKTLLQYMIERMPVNFKNVIQTTEKNKEFIDKRNLDLFANYIFERNGNPIFTTLKEETEIYQINYNNMEENIIFME